MTATSTPSRSVQALHPSPSNPSEPARTETCRKWILGNPCTKSTCPRAHHFFPTLVHRTHRTDTKSQPCPHWTRNGDCIYDAETCSLAHKPLYDVLQSAGSDKVSARGTGEEGWEAVLVYCCKSDGLCRFSTRDLDEMLKHVRGEERERKLDRPDWRVRRSSPGDASGRRALMSAENVVLRPRTGLVSRVLSRPRSGMVGASAKLKRRDSVAGVEGVEEGRMAEADESISS